MEFNTKIERMNRSYERETLIKDIEHEKILIKAYYEEILCRLKDISDFAESDIFDDSVASVSRLDEQISSLRDLTIEMNQHVKWRDNECEKLTELETIINK